MLIAQHEKALDQIQELVAKHGSQRSALIPILQEIRDLNGQISDFAMQTVADLLKIEPSEVYGVVTFYSFLSEQPQGRFVIRLCRTISCDMAGKQEVARQLENDLGIHFGQTTKDGRFTLEWANCMGVCDQGPAMLVNDRLYTQVTPERVSEILDSIQCPA
jgi:[NiFe] hydrogenase diaphorase moiety large subunit